MDLFEGLALVPILPGLSPYCGCCLQDLHVRKVSKMNLTNSGLYFHLVVSVVDDIGFHQAVLPA